MKKSIPLFSVLFLLSVGAAKAQFTDILNFTKSNGSYPNGVLTLSGKTLFGSTQSGGTKNDGCIFSLDTNGSGYRDLFDFNGTNGNAPGSIIIAGTQFFGMTFSGGAHGYGLIFSTDTNGKMYKDLYDFNGTNGANGTGFLKLSGKILYGMTPNGGAHDSGCIFKIDTDGSSYKDIYDFKGAPDGNRPFGSLTLSTSGTVLYGMTILGGLKDSGCIFSVDTNGSAFKILLSFTSAKGDFPQGTLTLLRGDLFGMAQGGGLYGGGCIFRIDTSGNGYNDMFDFNGTNGFYPDADLTLSGNKFYGTTSNVAFADSGGVIFSIDTNGSGFKLIHYFVANNGFGPSPFGNITVGGGVLYGDTYYGGPDSVGYVFKMDTTTPTAIKEVNAISGGINVYPNPSNGVFTISLSHAELVSAPQTIEIYNVLGEKVYSQFNVQPSTFNIDLSAQPSGVYMYRILSQSGNLIGEGKLILQR